jgi:hypothetical protein
MLDNIESAGGSQTGGVPPANELILGHLHSGFVAMEYFALILNRSFLVFITDAWPPRMEILRKHNVISSRRVLRIS